MSAWKSASNFQVIGIYIGGASRSCPNPALDSPGWVNAVVAQGWSVMPTYVGLQAPCTGFYQRMDPAWSNGQGVQSADDAAQHAAAAGIGPGAPIYFDLESYNPDEGCTNAVKGFLAGWVHRLHDLGYVAGVYGNLNSGIQAAAEMLTTPSSEYVDAVWIALWRGPTSGSLTGFDSIPDHWWSHDQRAHQFMGDHDETWGGVTMNIDSNLVNGPVYSGPKG
jgi:hypothetical protein